MLQFCWQLEYTEGSVHLFRTYTSAKLIWILNFNSWNLFLNSNRTSKNKKYKFSNIFSYTNRYQFTVPYAFPNKYLYQNVFCGIQNDTDIIHIWRIGYQRENLRALKNLLGIFVS